MMVVHAIDRDALRFLEIHEARVHALPARRVRDVGDAVLLHDPLDREPFWNRLAAIRWPDEPAAFDRRLDEAITLFAVLDRAPHVWPRPVLNEPADLVERLLAAGFEDVGSGHLMILDGTDRLPALPAALAAAGPGVTLDRLHLVAGDDGARAAADAAVVLAEAFAVEPARAPSLEMETRAGLELPIIDAFLARVDGEPAAVAKLTTFDGASYVSSVGTRPAFRGRGLATLVTAAAGRAAVEAGSRWTYLGVYDGNRTAQRLYERLGFVTLGAAPDLLLR